MTSSHPERSEGSAVSRREVVKSFSLIGMAAALDVSLPSLERATTAVAGLAQQQPAYTPKFYTAREWRTLRVLVDYIIPRDSHSGSATDAKVPEFMDFLLADKDATDGMKTWMRGGLAWLDEESRNRFAKDFTAAADADRRRILDDIAWPDKAPAHLSHGTLFFTRIRDFTASGFYSSQVGWKDLQYMGNVSLPRFDGCPQPALDKLGVSYDLMNSRVAPQK